MRNLFYTLDVLTDGSEFTGSGTLFLSVWKLPATSDLHSPEWLQEQWDTTTPLARYAICGLGDATARLCADQRCKLGVVRTVILPGAASADGLSALLLALSAAGSPSLHVVVGTSLPKNIEELVTLSLGRQRDLSVRLCNVPSDLDRQWWEVYSDEFLVVHACRSNDAEGQSGIVFLYSLCPHHTKIPLSFLFLPSTLANRTKLANEIVAGPLPLVRDDRPASIDFVICPSRWTGPPLRSGSESPILLVTHPQNKFVDPGILIRSQQVAKQLHEAMPQSFPVFRPLNQSRTPPDGAVTLKSCTSLVLATEWNNGDTPFVWDRSIVIWNKYAPVGGEWESAVESLKHGSLQTLEEPPRGEDENEIDLDDTSEEGNDQNLSDIQSVSSIAASSNSPRLVVLGTGCATPSAVRGASGYALSFPSAMEKVGHEKPWTFLLDCGEGTTMMLARTALEGNSGGSFLRQIRGIWISHAHLDHYGGLTNLLRFIHHENISTTEHDARKSTVDNEDRETGSYKRARIDKEATPPWVMAPSKVLRYLDLLLGCRHGRRQSTNNSAEILFTPLVHHDPTIPRGPWCVFHNIQVTHNCCPSYGLLLGWNVGRNSHDNPSDSMVQWFCYSGDTRPCAALVQACRQNRSNPEHEPLFLLHEATFADDEREMAVGKKHSTFSEAKQVAVDVAATRVLLSHFSHRYDSLQSNGSFVSQTQNDGNCLALAMDGLTIVL